MENSKNKIFILYGKIFYTFDGEKWESIYINDTTYSDNNFPNLKKPALVEIVPQNDSQKTFILTGGFIPTTKFINKAVYIIYLKREAESTYSCNIDFKYPDNKTARYMHQSVALDNENILLIGGKNDKAWLKSCEVLNLTTKKWNDYTPMNIERSNFDIYKLEDKVYAVGGFSGNCEFAKNLIECLDIKSQKWSIISTKGEIIPKLACSKVTSFDGFNLLILGGFNGTKLVDEVFEFSPDSKEITKLGKLKAARSNFHCFVQDVNVVLLGGSVKEFVKGSDNIIENYGEKFTFNLTNDIESEDISVPQDVLLYCLPDMEMYDELISEPGLPYSASIISKDFS
jgi:hypothetical protein